MAVGKASIKRAADANVKDNTRPVSGMKEVSETLAAETKRQEYSKMEYEKQKEAEKDSIKTSVIETAFDLKKEHPFKIYCELPDYLL